MPALLDSLPHDSHLYKAISQLHLHAAGKQGTFFIHENPSIQLSIPALFDFGPTPLHVLEFGIVLLMMTSYLRVVASVIYFGFAKNFKYLFITIFVLVILTASLILH